MKIPYGYVQNEKQEIRINQEQADVIRQIYDLYLQGKSLGGIAQSLESKHIPTPSGNKTWSRAAIDKILSNKKYITIIIPFEKYTEVQFEKDKRSNVHDNKKRKAARYNSQNVLSGLLVCGECGKNFRRITRANRDAVWRCADKVEHGKNSTCCNSMTIADTELKSQLCDELNLTEFNEQVVQDNVESIEACANGLVVEMKQQSGNMLIF